MSGAVYVDTIHLYCSDQRAVVLTGTTPPEEDGLYYIELHSEPAEKVECSDNTYDDQLDLSAVQALAQ